jgi:replication factor A2
MIKLVCAIRTSEARSTNTFLDVEDGTGIFQVKVFSSMKDDGSGDADCSAMQQIRMDACQDNQYVRIIGQVREFDGTRQVIANDVRVLSSGDELTYHYLEVAHSYEKHLKRKQQQGQGLFGGGMMGYGIGKMASSGGPPPHGGVGLTSHGGNLGGGSRLNDAVIAFIQNEGCEFKF